MSSSKALILAAAVLILVFPVFSQTGIQSIYEQGRQAQDLGNYYRAIELYKTVLESNPSYLDPLQGAAECYFSLGEYDEALIYAEQARRYAMGNPELKNLSGRILLGLGRFEEAESMFRQVLQEEPYNINAQFGMAEREIAQGKMRNAAGRYREALRISPENRRALLSLVLLYDEIGNKDAAENYITQALYFYSDVAEVRWIAARHYAARGDDENAWEHANAAFSLNPEYLEAGILLARLAESRGELDFALEVLESQLNYHRESPMLWYQLGVVYSKSDMVDPAYHAFSTALAMRSGDDMIRIALENLLLENTPFGDPRRTKYAQYHFDLGEEFESRNLMEKAAREFRRGLQLDPYSITGRQRLSAYFERKEYLNRFREELLILQREGVDGTDLTDSLEILETDLEESLSRIWSVDQFSLPRQEYKLGVYLVPRVLMHQGGAEDLVKYMEDLFEGEQNLSISDTSHEIDGFAEAFKRARELDTDYFMIIEAEETERIFSLKIQFYLSETGGPLAEWQIFRTGNHRIPEALRKAVADLGSVLVPYGMLLERRFDTGLVDLGKMDGVKPGDEFIVVRSGAWELLKDGFGFSYGEDDVVGSFVVENTDDLICTGTLKNTGFFDMINQGDMLFPVPAEQEADAPGADPDEIPEELPAKELRPNVPPDIYDTLLRLSD